MIQELFTPRRAMLLALSFLTTVSNGYAVEPSAEKNSELPTEEKAELWSSSLQLQIAPFENYPQWGGGVDTYLRWNRWRFGAELVVFAPREYGNVSRFTALLQPSFQFFLIDTSIVDWTAGAGLGLGVFRDGYLQIYDDVTSVAPGFTLSSEVEWELSRFVHPTLGFRAVSYFANDVADDKWLQFTLGARFLWGRQ